MREFLRLTLASLMLLSQASGWAQSADVVDFQVEVNSTKKGVAGQKEAFEQAIEKGTLQYVQEMIGEARAAKNSSVIKNRVLRNSGRYVSLIRSLGVVPKEDVVTYKVQLKISLKNLEALLLNEGLLYRSDGPPRILPVISVVDRVGAQSLSWWTASGTGERAFLVEVTNNLHLRLREELRGKGFFVLDPLRAGYRTLIPSSLAYEGLSTDDLLLLAESLRSQVIIKGQVAAVAAAGRGDAYRLEVRLAALHANNGRVIGEVVRSYDLGSGVLTNLVQTKMAEVGPKFIEDLGTQIFDAWKSGTFGATLLNVAVVGDLSYQQLNEFKRLLTAQVKDLRALRERMFEPGRVVFETDTSTNAETLAEKLKASSFAKFQVSVSEVRPGGISLRVSPL